MRKKLIASIFSVIMTTTLFIGCSSSPSDKEVSESTEDNVVTNATNDEKIEVSFWHYFTEPDGPVFLKYVEEFNNSQDKIVVKPEFVPREELLKQYTMGLVAGNLPDMGMVDNPDHASFSAMGVFADITDKFNDWDENQFLEGPINSCKYEERIYGLPQSSNCLALFYDKDMLEEAGVEPPTTWDELEDAAIKLTQGERYGLAYSAVKNEEGTFQFTPFFLSAGASVENLDSPEAIKAVSFLANLISEGAMSKEVINWTQGDVEKQFTSGKAAMMINGPWNIPAVNSGDPDKNWSVVKVPMDKEYASVLGGENFVITKGQNEDACWEFLKWFCGKDVSERYNKEISKFSPRSDIDPLEVWADDEVMQVFGEQMKYAMPRGPHPKWPEISSAISTAYHEVFTGTKTAEEAMKAAQIKVDEINSTLND